MKITFIFCLVGKCLPENENFLGTQFLGILQFYSIHLSLAGIGLSSCPWHRRDSISTGIFHGKSNEFHLQNLPFLVERVSLCSLQIIARKFVYQFRYCCKICPCSSDCLAMLARYTHVAVRLDHLTLVLISGLPSLLS